MKRIFFDMDGTLATYKPVEQIEEFYQPGYFSGLDPQMAVIDAAKKLIQDHRGEAEVFVLSAVFPDNPGAIQEKIHWLDQYLPEIDQEHRIFSPVGMPKHLCVPGGIRPDDILLDDYTVNLLTWADFAIGVKLLNGINHSRGTWKGIKVHKEEGAVAIVETLLRGAEKSEKGDQDKNGTE